MVASLRDSVVFHAPLIPHRAQQPFISVHVKMTFTSTAKLFCNNPELIDNLRISVQSLNSFKTLYPVTQAGIRKNKEDCDQTS